MNDLIDYLDGKQPVDGTPGKSPNNTERARLRRERMREQGKKPMMLWLEPEVLNVLRELAKIEGIGAPTLMENQARAITRRGRLALLNAKK